MANLDELNQMVTRFFALELPIATQEDMLKTPPNRVGSKVSLGNSAGKGAEGLDALMVVTKQPTGAYQAISFPSWLQQNDMKNKDDQTMAKEVSKLLKNGQMVFSQYGCEFPSRLRMREDGKSLKGEGMRRYDSLDMKRPKLGPFKTFLRAINRLDPEVEKAHEQAKLEYAMFKYANQQADQVARAVHASKGELQHAGGSPDRGAYFATNEADKEDMPLIIDKITERNNAVVYDENYNVDPVATTNQRIAAEDAALEELQNSLPEEVSKRREEKLQPESEISAVEFQKLAKRMQDVSQNMAAQKDLTNPRLQEIKNKLENIQDLNILKVMLQSGPQMKKGNLDILVASVLLQGMGKQDPRLDPKTNTKELTDGFKRDCEVMSKTQAFQDTVYNGEKSLQELVGNNMLFDAFTKNVISNQQKDQHIRTFTNAEMQCALAVCRDPEGMKKHMAKAVSEQQKTDNEKPLTQGQAKLEAQKNGPKLSAQGK